eukprot:SAG11_NODE_33445_length_277_cov_0.831461_1_plen_47_part_10
MRGDRDSTSCPTRFATAADDTFVRYRLTGLPVESGVFSVGVRLQVVI